MVEKPKFFCNGCSCNEAPKSNDTENAQRPSPCRVVNWRINICNKRSTAQMYGVGEKPLNGKGVARSGNAVG